LFEEARLALGGIEGDDKRVDKAREPFFHKFSASSPVQEVVAIETDLKEGELVKGEILLSMAYWNG